MTTQELVDYYLELFRSGNAQKIYDELYSTDIVCTEPEHAAAFGVPTVTKGIADVKAKAKGRQETIEQVHSFYCSDAVVAGGFFSVAMGRELTFKNGQRRKVDEIAVFGVKDGKIVSETFFY